MDYSTTSVSFPPSVPVLWSFSVLFSPVPVSQSRRPGQVTLFTQETTRVKGVRRVIVVPTEAPGLKVKAFPAQGLIGNSFGGIPFTNLFVPESQCLEASGGGPKKLCQALPVLTVDAIRYGIGEAQSAHHNSLATFPGAAQRSVLTRGGTPSPTASGTGPRSFFSQTRNATRIIHQTRILIGVSDRPWEQSPVLQNGAKYHVKELENRPRLHLVDVP